MRVSALLDPDASGTLTENGNVVGEITAGGTLGLVIFEGIFGGLMAGLLWVVVREWLPASSWRRILAAGIVAALLGSFLVVSAENRDFRALDAPAANVAMFIAIVGLTGSGAAFLDTRLEHLLLEGSRVSVILGVFAVIGGLMALALVSQAFLAEDFCGCNDPPRLAVPFIALTGVASVIHWSHDVRRRDAEPRWLRPAGTAALIGACLFAGIDLFHEIGEIL